MAVFVLPISYLGFIHPFFLNSFPSLPRWRVEDVCRVQCRATFTVIQGGEAVHPLIVLAYRLIFLSPDTCWWNVVVKE